MLRRGLGVAVAFVAVAAALALGSSGVRAAVLTSAGDSAQPSLGMGPAHWYGPNDTYGNWGPAPPPPEAPPPADPDPPENLANPGNGEIMPTTSTYAIFWLPSGNHFSNGTTAASDTAYENTVLKYFQDVGGTQILNTTTQYSGNNGSPSDTSNFVTSIVDTTAYPHAGTKADPLTQTDLNTEVFNDINSNSWPYGLSTMYFIFLPNGVVDCNDAKTKCNTNSYCAYHTYGFKSGSDTPANDFVWADIPDNFSPTTTKGGCGDSNVTGNESADTTLSSTEHEHMEAITDPRLNAWQDSTGAENGDRCNREMGAADASKTTANNYLGGGAADAFRIQREWSNAANIAPSFNGCAASYTTTGSHVESPVPTGGDVTLSVAEATIAGNPSDTLHYSVSFRNPSNQDDADGIVATVTLPSGVQSGGSGTVVLHLGNLAPHQTAHGSFTANPTSALLDGTTLTAGGAFDFTDSTGAAQPTITRTATTTVDNAQPTLNLPGPQSVDFNDPLGFGISASDVNSGDSIALHVSGLPSGLTFTDNGNRTGTVSGTDTADPGTYVVTFSAEDHHHASAVTGTVTITVTKEEAALTYNGSLTSDYHDPTTVSATLTDPDGGAPIAGKTVTFDLNGSATDTCSASTDGSGLASCSITPTQAAGTVPLSVAFAGDTDYVAVSTAPSFTITKEETTTTYTGPLVILAGGSGVTLSGKLLEDGNAATPISGRMLTLTIGGQSCTGTTNASGDASCTVVFSGPLGPEPVSASFAGDAFYLPSADTGKSAIVFAFPNRGAFVLGDTTVAGAGSSTVTWWADVWSSLNTLGAGPAPAAFKGFAGTLTLPSSTPPVCPIRTFTTRGGNSPPPTSGVPSYMGVVVASSVSKSGSTISGTYQHIVVVQVNPGYAPDPGDHGTGTIIAAYC